MDPSHASCHCGGWNLPPGKRAQVKTGLVSWKPGRCNGLKSKHSFIHLCSLDPSGTRVGLHQTQHAVLESLPWWFFNPRRPVKGRAFFQTAPGRGGPPVTPPVVSPPPRGSLEVTGREEKCLPPAPLSCALLRTGLGPPRPLQQNTAGRGGGGERRHPRAKGSDRAWRKREGSRPRRTLTCRFGAGRVGDGVHLQPVLG